MFLKLLAINLYIYYNNNILKPYMEDILIIYNFEWMELMIRMYFKYNNVLT